MLFVIQPEASQAQFQIEEVLAGSPNTVIGTTHKVAGVIRLDLARPAASQVGPITVETGTLVTDNSFRNRAISNFILQSGKYPLATFTSTALAGMPASMAVGATFKFTLTGDLTLRDITKPVTFEVAVTAEAADRISGKATATVRRADFALTIPSVPQVASVSEDVRLEFDFTAQRSG
jgi:polyisoprenoid-binding protein YceI